jgi:NADH-quinone oxidoreductase subunit D
MDDPVIHARTKGVGVLTKEDAIAYGTVGPTARGSGIPDDIRRDEPYAGYDMVDWNVITYEGGDVFAKAAVRLLENFESVKIIKQSLEQMRPGPIETEVRTIPPGEGIGHHEAPRGEVFHYVRSDGSSCPVRHKIRAPSSMNIPSFKASCIGETIADVALITAAVDPCYCCTERMAVVDRRTRDVLTTGEELVRMSREKTRRIKADLGQETPIDKLARTLQKERL